MLSLLPLLLVVRSDVGTMAAGICLSATPSGPGGLWTDAAPRCADMIICGSKREQLTPEQTTAAAATASLLALPAAKDFLLSTTTGSILSEYLMEVKGFDTRCERMTNAHTTN